MLKEFRDFAMRGNVLDLAIAVVVGAAFTRIVDSLVGDIIMPIIGAVTGGVDFSNYFLPLSKAVLAVISLFYAVAYWNNFFNALLYLNDSATWPLPLVLRLYVIQGAHLPGAMSPSNRITVVEWPPINWFERSAIASNTG